MKPLRKDWVRKAKRDGRTDAIAFGTDIGMRREYLRQYWGRLDSLQPGDAAALLAAWDAGVKRSGSRS